jgi:uncharacterized protein YkwD
LKAKYTLKDEAYDLEAIRNLQNNQKRFRRLDEMQLTESQMAEARNNTVDLHNYYRSLSVNTDNLSMSEKINEVSQNYSQYLASLPGYRLVHSGNSAYGENLFLECRYGVVPDLSSEFFF